MSSSKALKVVFMGCPAFAVPSLKRLASSPDFQVTCVYCMPDRPQGRGRLPAATPVKTAALKLGISVRQPASFRSSPQAIEELQEENPDFLVVVAYGLILPQSVLDIPRIAPVNLHASLLPKYRGPSPIQAAIMAGDDLTGNTIIRMNAKMDEGDILASETISISESDDCESLSNKLAISGAELLKATLLSYAAGDIVPQPQDHSQATYTQKISSETAHINWNDSAQKLCNLIRAMFPSPGAWFEIENLRFKIGKAVPDRETEAQAGTVLSADATGLRIACGMGTSIKILRIQRPGKTMMSVEDFLRGFDFKYKMLYSDKLTKHTDSNVQETIV